MNYKPGNFSWIPESINVVQILEYDYRALNRYAGGYGWNILKFHKYELSGSRLSNVYDKIRDHMWSGHTDKTFIWSMNCMKYIAKFGWEDLIKYTTDFPYWYIHDD
jgi:hypothetical protein